MKRAKAHILWYAVLTVALVLLMAADAQAAKKAAKKADTAVPEGPKPWTLHPRYTYIMGKCAMDFDETSAEWRIFEVNNTPAGDTLIQGTGPVITFEDGSALRAEEFGKGQTSRDLFSSVLGDGTHYTLTFPPKNGLTVTQQVSTFKDWQFVLVSTSVANNSDKPITIRELAPLSVGSGGMTGWGPKTIVNPRYLALRAGYPLFDKEHMPAMTTFYEPDRDICVEIGVIPQGRAAAGVPFQASAGAWQGQVCSQFTPAVTVAPGQTIESDVAWLSFGQEELKTADELYGWALSRFPRPEMKWETAKTIRGWVAVEEGKDLHALLRAAQLAPGMGISHALIPADWEGRPGSLEGAAPRYPKNMPQAAKTLRDAGMTPGITVDPIAAQGGQEAWCAKSADGQTWVNLAVPEGRAFAEKRMKTVAGWGFGFLVAAHSAVPDEVLKAFNLTRVEADRLAFETLVAASGGAPVFSAALCANKPDNETCLAAAAAVARMGSNLIVAGPLRLSMEGIAELPENGTALRFWPGPLEIVGTPSGKCREALGQTLGQGALSALPMDVAYPAPKLWRVTIDTKTNGFLGSAVICFPGAPEWKQDMMKPNAEGNFILWNAATGQTLDATQPVKPGETLETYGLTPIGAAPAFMGLSKGLALALDKVVSAKWDEQKGMLSVSAAGPIESGTAARVYVPESWEFDSGKTGDKVLRKGAMTGRVLCFDLESGDTAQFDLKFKKH